MKLSVIICTYNRAELLERVLVSLMSQTLSPDAFEIVVIDDGSTDSTKEIVRKVQGEKNKADVAGQNKKMLDSSMSGAFHPVPNIIYIHQPNQGAACARNTGIKAAKGKYLAFIDDDCIAPLQWASHMCRALENKPIVVGAIESPRENYVKWCHNISEFHSLLADMPAGPKEFLAGANMAFRRTVLDDVGEFREELRTAQDMDLVIRARKKGYCPYFMPEVVVTHDPQRITVRDIVRYAAFHASKTILLRQEYRDYLKTPRVLSSPLTVLLASPVIAMVVSILIYKRQKRWARYGRTIPLVYLLKLAWCFGAAHGLWSNRKYLH